MSLVLLQPTGLPLRDRDLAVTRDSPAPLLLARRMAAGPSATDLLDRLRTLPAPPSGAEQ
ncbi:MAG: hypothetical protein HOQ38_07320, partial [Nonomuraea sp.]|nr:hypothetical protein [Nonomuraea sp.]